MNIFAMDPALSFGWAHSSGQHGFWQLAAGSEHEGKRYIRLREHLAWAYENFPIDWIAAEHASKGAQFRQIAEHHGKILGIVLLTAAEHGTPFVLLEPKKIKLMAGGGNYSKGDMLRAVQSKLGIQGVTCADEADALWCLEAAKHEILEVQQEKIARRAARHKPREIQREFT